MVRIRFSYYTIIQKPWPNSQKFTTNTSIYIPTVKSGPADPGTRTPIASNSPQCPSLEQNPSAHISVPFSISLDLISHPTPSPAIYTPITNIHLLIFPCTKPHRTPTNPTKPLFYKRHALPPHPPPPLPALRIPPPPPNPHSSCDRLNSPRARPHPPRAPAPPALPDPS